MKILISWVYRFKRHLKHVNTNLWRIIEEGFYPHDPSNFTPREAVDNQFNESALFIIQDAILPEIFLIFDLMSWLKTHGNVLCLSIGEVRAFNAPSMKWRKMKPMSLL